MRVSLVTLGCRTNQAETMQMESDLLEAGHQIVPLSAEPDVCIVNTCSVTARADTDSRRLLSHALEKAAKVIATGCFVEINPSALLTTDSRKAVPVKNSHKALIPRLLGHASSGSFSLSETLLNRHRPIVKVQDGCNASCTYCTVPLARGSSRSVPVSDVVQRVISYHSRGCREVVLSGIHIGSYGRDLHSSATLAGLIREILSRTPVTRLRISSIEPGDIDDDLIDSLTSSRLCRHIHLPLQSGDDDILRAMNRPYTVELYLSVARRLLTALPGLALGTDVIVGFPGEEPGHFERTLNVLESIPFAYLHAFPYSPRPNTKASALSPTVPEAEKRLRVTKLRQLGHKMKADFVETNRGVVHEALVESRRGPDYVCTTGNYIKVFVSSRLSLTPGTLVNVRITGRDGDRARAVPIT